MTVKINSEYSIAFLVTNDSGQRVATDSPTVTIQNVATKSYFNGIGFFDEPSSIIMSHFGNGLYIYNFTAKIAGEFEIVCSSNTYRTKTISTLIVSSSDDKIQYVKPGVPYTVSVPSSGADASPRISIFREKDASYLISAGEWSVDKTWQSMVKENLNYTFSFTPEMFSEYRIEIIDSRGETSIVVVVPDENAEEKRQVVISSSTFSSNDGTNSVVVNGLKMPLAGAEILCYQLNDPENKIVGKATTDSEGKWSMSVPEGRYYFMFRADGYISKGFERQVK